MPRPNPPRAMYAERNLAARIAAEREARGWSLERLAKEVTDAGCAINASSIYKIESGDPPRKIGVDELIALSDVFGVPMEHLVLPLEVATKDELAKLVTAWVHADIALSKAERERAEARQRRDAAGQRVREFIAAHPDLRDSVALGMEGVAEHLRIDEDRLTGWHALKMWELTGDKSWADIVRREIDDEARKAAAGSAN